VRAQITGLAGDGLAGAMQALIAAWATLPDKGLAAAVDALQPLARQPGLEVLQHLHGALLADVAGDQAAARAGYDQAVAVSADKRSLRLTLLVGNFLVRSGDRAAAIALYQDLLSAGSGLGVIESALATAESAETPAPIVASAAE